MNQNKLKKKVAHEALKYIKNKYVVGIGTGTTINYFIDALKKCFLDIKCFVSSSNQSSNKLKKFKIPIIKLNKVKYLDIYIDSADEIDKNMCMIKGGGGALTKEKILAQSSKKFLCIIDESKKVKNLGKFPLPIEIIPIAKNLICKEMLNIGGKPIIREGIITENNNIIIDVHNLFIDNPIKLEKKINNIPGVVTVGLFAKRKADIVLIGNNKNIDIVYNKQ